jgi:IclR family pca regulon transcriptional regulator
MKPSGTLEKSRYNIEALVRGLEVLSLFTPEHPALSLSQIVETLKINKSTAYRVLSTLEATQYLEQDAATRLYRPSVKVLRLGFTAINSIEMRQIAKPYLEKLALDLDETVSLAVLDDFHTVYIERVRNQSIVGVVLSIGSRLPAHCSSLGKVLLAGLSLEELNDNLAHHELTAYTQNTITSHDKLIAELELIRQRGYAIGNEELTQGLRAAAAPILDGAHKTVASVNVTGLGIRITDQRLQDEIVPALLDTTAKISAILGYLPTSSS